ncbi:MAG: carboxymuconolactone decarboxylase family protein [Bacillota bacterium]|nr:carboxymuconolactone decarboxylase family protein [Bacillota bacterium]
MSNKRFDRGKQLLLEIVGQPALQTQKDLNGFAPDAATFLAEYFGDFYSRTQLDVKTRELVTVSVLAATGKLPQLKVHFQAAMNVGWTNEELIETMLQLILYTGFPTALNALETLHQFLLEKEIG